MIQILFSLALASSPGEDDPLVPGEAQAPYFDLLGVEEAWDLVGDAEGCIVGVLDMGYDFFHPALSGTLEPGYHADGVHHLQALSIIAHGTSMASLIGARRVAEDGMVGLAPRCRLLGAAMGMPRHRLHLMRNEFLQANPGAGMAEWQQEMMKRQDELASFGEEWIGYVARTSSEGIRSLVEDSARVINFSAFVGKRVLAAHPEHLERIEAAFALARERDVLIVIGAGNTATEEPDYPGDPGTVLVVGASMLDDQRWEIEVDVGGGRTIKQGSCFGPRLSVVAPMENLVTARPHDEAAYGWSDGPIGPESAQYTGDYEQVPYGATSMATAVASALAGLVRTARPDLDAATVVEIVQRSAVDLGEPGWDAMTGHGRIDFAAAVELALDIE